MFPYDYPRRDPVPFGQGVTARTALLAEDGHYPLRVISKRLCVRTFLTIASATIQLERYEYTGLLFICKGLMYLGELVPVHIP